MRKKNHWAFYIKEIFDALRDYSNTELHKYNLTVVQAIALMELYDSEDGTLTMKEMEKAFGIAQSTTVGLVSRLEKKGFVKTFTSPEDKRVKHVKITESGMAYCCKSEEYMSEGERRLLTSLSKEEQIQFCNMLKKISDTINQ